MGARKKISSIIKGAAIYAFLLALVACSSSKPASSGSAASTTPAVASTADTSAEEEARKAEEEKKAEEERKAAEEEAKRKAEEEEAARKAAEEEAARQAEEERKAEEERLAQEEAENFLEPEWMLGRIESISEELGLPVVYGEDPDPGSQAKYYIFVEAEHDGRDLYGFIIALYPGDSYWYTQAYSGQSSDSVELLDDLKATSVQQIADFMAQYCE